MTRKRILKIVTQHLIIISLSSIACLIYMNAILQNYSLRIIVSVILLLLIAVLCVKQSGKSEGSFQVLYPMISLILILSLNGTYKNIEERKSTETIRLWQNLSSFIMLNVEGDRYIDKIQIFEDGYSVYVQQGKSRFIMSFFAFHYYRRASVLVVKEKGVDEVFIYPSYQLEPNELFDIAQNVPELSGIVSYPNAPVLPVLPQNSSNAE